MPRTSKSLSFKGGYRFKGFQGNPTTELVEIAPGSTSYIPISDSSTVSIAEGDTVTVGQTVARRTAPTNVTVSPVAGTVTTITDSRIEVAVGGDQAWPPVQGFAPEWENLPAEKIEDILLESGTTGWVAKGLPTRHDTSALVPSQVRRVVVHDLAADVYAPSASALTSGREISELVEGLAILRKLYPDSSTHVVLGKANEAMLASISDATQGSGMDVSVRTGSAKYPQNLPPVLLGSLFKDDVPDNPSAADFGAVVLDLQALLQVRDAVVLGKPAIARIVALAGPGLTDTPHVSARVGTPLSAVLADRLITERSPRLVLNSVMTGVELAEDAVVDGTWSVVIALPKTKPEFLPFATPGFRSDSLSFTFAQAILPLPKTLDDNIHGEERACLSCGFCVTVCPVDILPFHLHRFAQRNIIDEKLIRYGALKCIDCNLCTYVCPAKIPVARLISDGKKALVAEGYVAAPADQPKEGVQ